ncbi:Holliday junction branch migration protein RuvA [Paenibacillus melissococcoides]|uniref:Holliday junction branch migration complex subunit RuvA n=1 Tax=Paenibacillus melissococcoides TaxID=2912268 RepID=A0ABM9FW71_9BACL|nr:MULTISPECIES: Holliday junction branch migration protein RuvA [Paenibacillus]MEB9895405.1 Holliday junction branch migration protein RuvA [Bacillus cereus]CAH8243414.1 Holliday junction branch migration protein RuvA [Paenibacillus melissococcoides]CAH8704443.1 Holliday junction branch migration protein RuvA [Paenibacillus melissococcoides]CAH8707712.1 Holliday junction branch migration protein RuvA [Paenibacillus melissococcoides]GIO76534.1 Holliday junction ATP-dependent DNA helicase RuvA 
MIDFVRGPVVHWEADYVVLDVQGIGYRIYTPNPYAFAKSEAAVTVYTHHHVREDAILLFGFASRQEQKLFRRLIEVSGVGPKVALGILSAGNPDSVVAAIQQENYSFLTKLPGIGKKTAQRIVLDLKDKLDGMGWDIDPGALFAEVQTIEGDREDGAWDEAREALKALGYKDVELERVWNDLQHRVHADESVDSLMKKALQLLFTG